MSFITNSLFKPLAQWYSEINSATLTGAIDVVVVEQDDGSFLSSPFHVRFGKLGVLKAKEKIVDIEINDEPVDIHMKLDDNGTAFFVEDVEEDEEGEIPPELATSPIPGQIPDERRINDVTPGEMQRDVDQVTRSLMEDFEKAEEEAHTSHTSSGTKGKLNRKKRRRKHQFNSRHSRSGSKSSLKEIMGELENPSSESSSAETSSNLPMKSSDNCSQLNDYDKENDGDLDDDLDTDNNETSTPINSLPSNTSTPQHHANNNTEHSFLQSRLGDEPIESILETQEKLDQQQMHEMPAAIMGGPTPEEQAELTNQDYFSEPELPTEERVNAEGILSDSEVETHRRLSVGEEPSRMQNEEQSWEWGQLPTTANAQNASCEGDDGSDTRDGQDQKDTTIEKRSRRWTFSFWNSNSTNKESQNSEPKKAEQKSDEKSNKVPGVYLDDLKGDDEEMMAIYVGTRHYHHQPMNIIQNQVEDDEDAESGNGPSLPMSPHSVEGAIGGARIRYDSSDDDRQGSFRHLPEMNISLCGDLASPEDTPELSKLLFEQSIVSFDDLVTNLTNGQDIFSNQNLVVRIGDRYHPWKVALPIIMSYVLYGRKLPSDVVKKLNNSYTAQESSSKDTETTPNNKSLRRNASSSWWPFSSSSSTTKTKDDASQTEKEAKQTKSSSTTTLPELKDDLSRSVEKVTFEISDEMLTINPKSSEEKKNDCKQNASEAGYSSSDSDMKTITLSDSFEGKRFKKTLRLSTDAIKRLNLRPGSNEAQFSVTTAYQGTSRCKCHIYWWKSTDKIVISDIDGTITKSDVLGHVLPIIGRDWAQSGVASLFTKIVNNGYQIAYLSARAIGQASITKDYLASIRQGDVNLPDGPLFLNPTSLVSAFHREVIEKKPEKFKIACLRDIQKLFPEERNPFYAGYGNRVNDVFAYRTVGIPISRIFTINSKGELRHELTQTFLTSYTAQSSEVNRLYPPTAALAKLTIDIMKCQALKSKPRKISDFDDTWSKPYEPNDLNNNDAANDDDNDDDDEMFHFSSGEETPLRDSEDVRSLYGDALSSQSSAVRLSELDS